MQKKLSQDDINEIILKCIKLVKKKPANFFVLKNLRTSMGLCYDDHIEVNPARQFLETSIHECVHFLYPEWSETMVVYAESRVMNSADYEKLMEFSMRLSLKLYKKEKKKNKHKLKKDKEL